ASGKSGLRRKGGGRRRSGELVLKSGGEFQPSDTSSNQANAGEAEVVAGSLKIDPKRRHDHSADPGPDCLAVPTGRVFTRGPAAPGVSLRWRNHSGIS